MNILSEMSDGMNTLITEGADGQKDYFIEGTFMQADTKNHNNRIYPSKILNEQVKIYNEAFVSRKRALGELGHPDTISINLERVSHNIVELREEGNGVIYGKAKIMTHTPYGQIAANFIREGIQLGVSSRGGGATSMSNGVAIIQRFKLSAVDIVADPSAPEAFVSGIMEGHEWIYEGGVLTQRQLESLQDAIDQSSAKSGTGFTESQIFKMLDNIRAK